MNTPARKVRQRKIRNCRITLTVAALAYLSVSVLTQALASDAPEKPAEFMGIWEDAGARVAFKKAGQNWISALDKVSEAEHLDDAAAKYKEPKNWFIFFDGKSYGQIVTRAFDVYRYYHQIGLQQIVESPKVKFRKIEEVFSGWQGKQTRPIVLTSKKSSGDPEGWKPDANAKIDDRVKSETIKRLKGKVFFCKNAACEGDDIARDVAAHEIARVFSYKSQTGKTLVAVRPQFDKKVFAYCETQGDGCTDIGPFWYIKNAAGEVRFLTQAKALIDALALDDDKQSELVFWISEYNSDGYELIDGQSLKSVRAVWNYH